ncbi:hypothetical protein TIFTF001_039836 [Ficus carica]|uniref:Uncharacterized protein n=1 Tax=Ficus carica TaxID=3494 RepID=A0AA87YQU6_FICCA|nr:hypothetical protein TIFTF001_039822 [Ficus carica]GMN19517.1 hypothetical protein TIFTF001_039826 [Ficus carica]GMN19539.1 hypothetical protein TIFTF001_039832 [Ficus carica]GMN19547.1 hypothetical protein TIFTF001_039836 [Ficus carica]
MDADRDVASVFYEMQPLLFDGTRRTVALAGWLHDMESIFRIGHIEAHLQVPLASRCLVVGARIWLVPNEDAYMPYRDLEIYRDMYYRRYLNYVAN